MAISLVPLPTKSLPDLAPSQVKKICALPPAAVASRIRCSKPSSQLHLRRGFAQGLIAAGIGSLLAAESVNAGARRPPPPQPEEKKDPSITGLRAKVLASIKRKEAMKEQIAKLREKGKPVN